MFSADLVFDGVVDAIPGQPCVVHDKLADPFVEPILSFGRVISVLNGQITTLRVHENTPGKRQDISGVALYRYECFEV